MTDEQMQNLTLALDAAGCVCEMNAMLQSLNNEELDEVFNEYMMCYGIALADGALDTSEWVCNTLVINANQPAIQQIGMVLAAVADVHREAATPSTPVADNMVN